MRVFFALCALSLFSSAFAATVAVSVVQNADAPPPAIETTRLLESLVMDEYFDAGQIVTNMAIITDGPLSEREGRPRIREASEGNADYLLSIYLEYDPIVRQAARTGVPYAALKRAEWRLVDVRSSKIAGGGTANVEGTEMRQGSPNERTRGAAEKISRESLSALRGARR